MEYVLFIFSKLVKIPLIMILFMIYIPVKLLDIFWIKFIDDSSEVVYESGS